MKDFAKFAFTSWAFVFVKHGKKLKLKKMFGSWMSPLVGRHVVEHGKNLKSKLYVVGKI